MSKTYPLIRPENILHQWEPRFENFYYYTFCIIYKLYIIIISLTTYCGVVLTSTEISVFFRNFQIYIKRKNIILLNVYTECKITRETLDIL